MQNFTANNTSGKHEQNDHGNFDRDRIKNNKKRSISSDPAGETEDRKRPKTDGFPDLGPSHSLTIKYTFKHNYHPYHKVGVQEQKSRREMRAMFSLHSLDVTAPIIEDMVDYVAIARGRPAIISKFIGETVDLRIEQGRDEEEKEIPGKDIKMAFTLLYSAMKLKEFRDQYHFSEDENQEDEEQYRQAAPDRPCAPYLFAPPQNAKEELIARAAAATAGPNCGASAPDPAHEVGSKDGEHPEPSEPLDPDIALIRAVERHEPIETFIPRNWEKATIHGYAPSVGVRR